jgi:hypothetical protein
VAAISRGSTFSSWLDGERRPESISGVAWDVLPEQRLSLLLLRHAISSADGHSLELLHVVAVPERRLTEVSEEAITGFFESLYRSPLSMALPKLLASLAGLTGPEPQRQHRAALVAHLHHRAALHLAVEADRHRALGLDDAAAASSRLRRSHRRLCLRLRGQCAAGNRRWQAGAATAPAELSLG